MSNPNPNDGGQAFPVHNGTGWIPGMTLRDYFAAKAMAALPSHRDIRDTIAEDKVSHEAYSYADSMLKVRQA